MKKELIIAGVLVAVVLFVVAYFALIDQNSSELPETPQATSSPEKESKPAVNGPRRSVIGTSVEGREIVAQSFGDGSEHLVLVGGIHGGYEWNSVLLAYRFIDHFKQNPSIIPENVKLTVIPALNPDGVHEVVGTTSRFSVEQAPVGAVSEPGRFNAGGVDLNRNFACNWESSSTWRSQTVDAGTRAFSEPEARAFRGFVEENELTAAIFLHSAAGAVYGATCSGESIGPKTSDLLNTYAGASGYRAVPRFTAYSITGDVESWLTSKNIPAVSVELSNHQDLEWRKNRAGFEAVLERYGR